MFKNVDKSLRNVIILLAVVALVILGYDLCEVIAGQTDLNRHLPFLLPAVLGFFIWIAWTIGRLTSDDPEVAAKARAAFWPESCLNPRNTDRADQDHIE